MKIIKCNEIFNKNDIKKMFIVGIFFTDKYNII